MTIQSMTEDYERWLGTQVPLVDSNLRLKHVKMASPDQRFPFFRATYYRWIKRLPKICPETWDAPLVLAVGDLHVENFGTWRDADSRLVWGVNDFDEADDLPYSNDLVRLATSALIASQDSRLTLEGDDICEALESGYSAGIEARMEDRAEPYIIGERHKWLSPLARAREPSSFWSSLRDLPPVVGEIPKGAAAGFRRSFPDKTESMTVRLRTAGTGSLGRRRFCALAQWQGGLTSREAKEVAPPASQWANNNLESSKSRVPDAITSCIRAADPAFCVVSGWIVRRLAPDCGKIDLSLADKLGDERRLLNAMAHETANAQVINQDALKAIHRDLKKRSDSWLRKAATRMASSIEEDRSTWLASADRSV